MAALSSARIAPEVRYVNVRLIPQASPAIGAEGVVPIEQQPALEQMSPSKLLPHQRADVTPEAIDAPPLAPRFYGPNEVDKAALPYSAPDPDLLTGVVVSGVPIRLRLYIAVNGLVTRVEQLQALPDDREAVERIDKMLRDTTFMPAKLGGIDVNSYQDLEFNIGPELNQISAPS